MSEPDNAASLARSLPNPVRSFVLETNVGGIPITLCSCGVLLLQQMAEGHMAICSVLAQALDNPPSQVQP